MKNRIISGFMALSLLLSAFCPTGASAEEYATPGDAQMSMPGDAEADTPGVDQEIYENGEILRTVFEEDGENTHITLYCSGNDEKLSVENIEVETPVEGIEIERAYSIAGNEEDPIGLVIGGRKNGDYYSEIGAWDDNRYSYAYLKNNANKSKLEVGSESVSMPFYFATLEDINILARLHEVPTVDNTEHGPNSNPRKYESLYLLQTSTANRQKTDENGNPKVDDSGKPVTYDHKEADYYFGMELGASFVQTPSGLDGFGHDMIFEFEDSRKALA